MLGCLPSSTSEDGLYSPFKLFAHSQNSRATFRRLQYKQNIDTFPSMFPDAQFLEEAEIKHGRMSMLAWTGIWATAKGGFGLGLHFPGLPDQPDFTKALGEFAHSQPGLFGVIVGLIAIAEGESVGHSGDNFRGKGTKTPGDFGLYFAGVGKVSEGGRDGEREGAREGGKRGWERGSVGARERASCPFCAR